LSEGISFAKLTEYLAAQIKRDRIKKRVTKFGRFCTERPKRGRFSGKFVFLLLFSLILGKPKKYYFFLTDIDKDSFRKLPWGRSFSSAPIFSAKLAGKFCHDLATPEEVGFDQP
jgi:hypothetical protein